MNLDNINTIEELITAWRTYGYKVECIVVRAGSESIYYIGVDDDNLVCL